MELLHMPSTPECELPEDNKEELDWGEPGKRRHILFSMTDLCCMDTTLESLKNTSVMCLLQADARATVTETLH